MTDRTSIPKRRFFIVAILALASAAAPRPAARAADVRIRADAARQQYVIVIGGKPFTAYCFGSDFPDKPVFYPVMSPNGARVNREFPMVKDVPGESTDHPHHQSLFFTYDEVNGVHFWNPDTSGRRIVSRGVHVGATDDRLTADLAWNDQDGRTLLDETKQVRFGGDADVFWMDHDIMLRAAVPVTFGDTKEGAFGIRLNDTLKENGGSGRYVRADGAETAANIWGRTSPWVAIRGSVKDQTGEKPVTVAIFAHPSGLNFPPYWHARDYGLFAANPFARKAYDPSAPERITRLGVGDSMRLGFRLAVYAGKVETARLAQDFRSYSAIPLR